MAAFSMDHKLRSSQGGGKMKKRKITVLSATVLLAIVAFPLLTTAATEAPVRSNESFVLGTSGLQMNLQLDPQGGLLQATVGPAYVTPPPLVCPPNDFCSVFNTCDGEICVSNYYCPDLFSNPPPPSCEGPPFWDCFRDEGAGNIISCAWRNGGCDNPPYAITDPSCPASPPPPSACPPNDYCFDECFISGAVECGVNYYCPDLATNGPPGLNTCPGATWSCNQVNSIVICNWYTEPIGGVAFPCSDNVATLPTLCPLPINAPIINAAAVAAPASFETLPISDIRASLVCTGCDPVTNICDTSNGAICETREFVERNIMEEYEGSCTYKYTTTTGQTVTKTITGRPPSCP
jgi:hypothetical protein